MMMRSFLRKVKLKSLMSLKLKRTNNTMDNQKRHHRAVKLNY